MNFQDEYRQKLVSADEAVKIIKSGDWVDYGWCTGTPDVLDKALAKRTDELNDINLRGGILLKLPAIFEREDAGDHFTWNSWHMSGIERKAISQGFAYYCPLRYSELPRYYREHIGHINVEFESSYENAGPFGAKSIGEVVINTPLPAITDALSHAAGKRFYELPITPDQIAMASVKDN